MNYCLCSFCLFLNLFVIFTPVSIFSSLITSHEAAFQGRCEFGHQPCEQICFDIHNGMYECDCRSGFVLHSNGYNCIELNASIIESKSLLSSKKQLMELLEPKDIEVMYETKRNRNKNTLKKRKEEEDENKSEETHEETQRKEKEKRKKLEDVENYRDKVFEIDAFCNLKCGTHGVCVILSQGVKRCLCPLDGEDNELCRKDINWRTPFFSGYSHLSLPVLQNAYSDLKLILEFKPLKSFGILLLTGESQKLNKGDYLILLLSHGHVELRLDCGTGPGIVTTSHKIKINNWNTLSVFRHDRGVWIQLNDGPRQKGSSQGLFSRLTFNRPLVLGGLGTFQNVDRLLNITAEGFTGCFRRLEINRRVYDFRSVKKGGQSTFGLDISQCSDENCHLIPCQQSGKCILLNSGQRHCECPLGTAGDFCEKKLRIQIPYFTGSSYLAYNGMEHHSSLWTDLTLVFRSSASNALLLYNGQRKGNGNEDFLSLSLKDSFVELSFDLGDGVNFLRSSLPIHLERWTSLRVLRTGRLAEMSLNNESITSVVSSGAFYQLSLDTKLYLGGLPPHVSPPSSLVNIPSFKGCITKLTLNNRVIDLISSAHFGVNIRNCVENNCQGFKEDDVDFCCFKGSNESLICTQEPFNTLKFNGTSFAVFKSYEIYKQLFGPTSQLSFRLRVLYRLGIILQASCSESLQTYFRLTLDSGLLIFRFDDDEGEETLVYNQTRLDDGLWHHIIINRVGSLVTLRVDNKHQVKTISKQEFGFVKEAKECELTIGGVKGMEENGMIGCISELRLDPLTPLNLETLTIQNTNKYNHFNCDTHP